MANPFQRDPVYGPTRTMAANTFLNSSRAKAVERSKRPYLAPSANKVAGPTAPPGFNYGQVAAPQTASTVNTAAPTNIAVRDNGYTAAAGSDTANRVALMSKAAETRVAAPTPPPAVQTAPVASSGSTGGSRLSDSAFLRSVAEKKLTELQKNYTSTLAPSAAEQAAQQQLTDFMGSAQLGISGLEGQGRGIPLSLVRGQQGKLQEQANIKAQTLQNEIANYQAARAAAGDVYSAQLEFEGQRLQREIDQYNQKLDLQTKMLGAGYQMVDPAAVTDPNSVVQIGGQTFLKPTPEAKIYEIGNSLIDENGNVIYQGQEDQPATVQEYEYAKANGYTGSFLDYQKAKAESSSTAWGGSTTSAAGRVKDSKYLTDAQKLQSDFAANPVVQSYAKQQEGFEFASTFNRSSTNPYDDQALIFAFMKVLDPTSVVREGEYATAQRNTSLLEQMGVKLGSVISGQVLGKDQRNNLLAAIQNREQSSRTAYDSVVNQFSQTAQGYGIDPSDVITTYGSTGDYGAGTQVKATAPTEQFYTNIGKLANSGTYLKADGSKVTPQEAAQWAEEARQLGQQGYSAEEITDLINQEMGYAPKVSSASSSSAQQIAAAIKQVESGGNYNARGGSGEGGAYQFMPATWKDWAGKYLGNANAPMSQENQDKVATMRIQDWLNEGYTADQIALLWNSGKTTPVKGVNRYGVAYDSGAYRDKVLRALNA